MEKTIEKYFVDEAKKHGALALKFVSPGNAGVPDRIVLFNNGIAEFVEFKKPGGRLRPLQRVMIRRLEAYGHTVTIIDNKEAVDDYWSRRDDS